MKNIKEKILKLIRHKPFIRKVLSKIYLFFIKVNNTFKKIKFKKLYYINPSEINYISWKFFDIFSQEWNIIDGDWDLDKNLTPIVKYEIYQGLKERFINKIDWEETIYFKTYSEKISDWKILWNCSNTKELLERCKRLDTLYEDIKNNWYKLNKDPITWGYDEVTINIWRNWELLFNDWAHRLSIAKILWLKEIPVRIIARHRNWYNFIKYLKSVLPNQTSYQSLGHPDLDTNFTINHPCYNRFELFSPYLPEAKQNSKSLDIWGNIGFFTRELEKRWFNAYIIEHESFYLKILQKFKDFLWYKYTIIWEDMFEWKWINENKFNVVLALNIFHHFIKTEEFYEKLVQLLNNLKTDVIIFEAHNPDEQQMEWSYKNYSPLEFVKFIMKETWLDKYEEIWIIESDWRQIFKIYK